MKKIWRWFVVVAGLFCIIHISIEARRLMEWMDALVVTIALSSMWLDFLIQALETTERAR